MRAIANCRRVTKAFLDARRQWDTSTARSRGLLDARLAAPLSAGAQGLAKNFAIITETIGDGSGVAPAWEESDAGSPSARRDEAFRRRRRHVLTQFGSSKESLRPAVHAGSGFRSRVVRVCGGGLAAWRSHCSGPQPCPRRWPSQYPSRPSASTAIAVLRVVVREIVLSRRHCAADGRREPCARRH